MTVTVLLSGGIDSATCLAYFRRRRDPLAAVFIDYGQPVADRERTSCRAIAEWYGIQVHEYSYDRKTYVRKGEVPGRNAFLIFAAMLSEELDSGFLALGIHVGVGYYDCTPHFVTHANHLLHGYTNGQLTLATPFLEWDKKMIFDFAVQEEVPLHLTWSCETGPDEPCGSCHSCRDLEALRARA